MKKKKYMTRIVDGTFIKRHCREKLEKIGTRF